MCKSSSLANSIHQINTSENYMNFFENIPFFYGIYSKIVLRNNRL